MSALRAHAYDDSLDNDNRVSGIPDVVVGRQNVGGARCSALRLSVIVVVFMIGVGVTIGLLASLDAAHLISFSLVTTMTTTTTTASTVASASPTAPPLAPAVGAFLHISDIHLDVWYNGCVNSTSFCRAPDTRNASFTMSTCEHPAPFGQFGCDSPAQLLSALLMAIGARERAAGDSASSPRSSFAIISGDFAAHRMWNASTTLTAVRAASAALNETFAQLGVDLVPALGNNDCYPNYCAVSFNDTSSVAFVDNATENATALYLALFEIWSGEFGWVPLSERESFVRGGYYSKLVRVANMTSLRIIVLNTMLFSPSHAPFVPGSAADDEAQAQLKWFGEQLSAAGVRQEHTYVVAHIAPASNDYMLQRLWHEAYQTEYVSLVRAAAANANEVVAHLFGHTHRDHFALLGGANMTMADGMAFLMAPSVSPVSGTNPTFRLVLVAASSGQLLDYEQYFTDFLDSGNDSASFPQWTLEYAFDQAYDELSLSYQALRELFDRLRSDPALMALWTARQLALADRGRVAAICAAGFTEYKQFQECIEKSGI
jgi:hypothetical protein